MKSVEFNDEKIFVSMNKGRLEAIDTEGFPYMVISIPHESLEEDEFRCEQRKLKWNIQKYWYQTLIYNYF